MRFSRRERVTADSIFTSLPARENLVHRVSEAASGIATRSVYILLPSFSASARMNVRTRVSVTPVAGLDAGSLCL